MTEKSSKVLFCTVGATPQVVTETAWFLLRQTPSWKPQKIHIVTTAFKLDFIRKSLQTEDGPLGRLIGGVPPVIVHVPRRRGDDPYSCAPGQETPIPDDLLRDVNDQDEAARMGNLILRILAAITSDPSTALHVSLAGGRKTMSAHALMALSLVGRANDKASHVLVDAEYEDHPGFWHPEQGGEPLAPKRGSARTEPLDPAQAKVILVPTPAPLMRNRVAKGEELAQLDLLDLMNKANLAAALEQKPCVALNVTTNSICAHGVTIKLTPKHFAVYRLLATARQENWPGAGSDGVGPDERGWLTYKRIAGANADRSRTPIRNLMTQYIREAEINDGCLAEEDRPQTRNWLQAVKPQDVRERVENVTGNMNHDITRLKDEIAEKAGLDAAVILAPQRQSKTRGQARFGLRIDSRNIDIE